MSVEMPNAPYFERYYREYRPDPWLFEGSYHGLNGRRAQKAAIEYLLGHNFSGTEIYTQFTTYLANIATPVDTMHITPDDTG